MNGCIDGCINKWMNEWMLLVILCIHCKFVCHFIRHLYHRGFSVNWDGVKKCFTLRFEERWRWAVRWWQGNGLAVEKEHLKTTAEQILFRWWFIHSTSMLFGVKTVLNSNTLLLLVHVVGWWGTVPQVRSDAFTPTQYTPHHVRVSAVLTVNHHLNNPHSPVVLYRSRPAAMSNCAGIKWATR